MGLVKNWTFLQHLFFGKISLEKLLGLVVPTKFTAFIKSTNNRQKIKRRKHTKGTLQVRAWREPDNRVFTTNFYL